MRPYELFGALWRRRLLALVVLLVVLGATVPVLSAVPRSYEAVGVVAATGAVRADETDVGDAGAPVVDADEVDAGRTTVAGLVDSARVTQAVSADLEGRADVSRSPEELREAVAATVSGTTIRVAARDRDPEVAALVVRTVVEALQLDVPQAKGLGFTVAQEARVPTAYTRPGLRTVGLAGILLALVLAVLAAVVLDRRRRTVDDAREAEDAAGAPLLAHVWPPDDPTDLPALHPGTTDSDGFRRLRRALQDQAGEQPADVVVVAGLGGVETHVWVGANLAIDLALEGHEVLLVDGRLDGPVDAGTVEAPGHLGLSEVLGGAPLADALSPGPVRGLTVLPAGDVRRTDAEALLDAVFASVMTEARTRFDVVVVLPPPLQVSDDARTMAAGGSMLLTLPEASVSAATLRRQAEHARGAGTRLLGVVLVGRPAASGAR